MRALVLALVGSGVVVMAGAAWWQGSAMPDQPADASPAASMLMPEEVVVPASGDVEPGMVEIIGERHLDAPSDRLDAMNDDPAAVPVPSAEAVAALRDSMENGDPRTPPLARSEDLREMPTADELADPALYQQYEQRQNQKVYASFVTAASEKITELETLIARAEADGLPPEQIEEGRQKLQGLRNQRDEILQTHPEVAEELQSAALEEAGGQE